MTLAVPGGDAQRPEVDSAVGQGPQDAAQDPGLIGSDDLKFLIFLDVLHGLFSLGR